MTIVQPTLSLWDEPAPDHRNRILAHSTDRVAWLRARSRGITATDVAKLSTERSVHAVVNEKLHGSGFGGNVYTDYGTEREPAIARWVRATHRIEPSTALFHADGERSHLATPDGLAVIDGTVLLAEIKTTSTGFRTIPRAYLRQVWWQQYVLGAERTLFVWETHRNFVPVDDEPKCRWIDRDDNEIHQLIGLANRVLQAVSTRRPG